MKASKPGKRKSIGSIGGIGAAPAAPAGKKTLRNQLKEKKPSEAANKVVIPEWPSDGEVEKEPTFKLAVLSEADEESSWRDCGIPKASDVMSFAKLIAGAAPPSGRLVWTARQISLWFLAVVQADASIPRRAEIRAKLERIRDAAALIEEQLWDWDVMDMLHPPSAGHSIGRGRSARSPEGQRIAQKNREEFERAIRALKWIIERMDAASV